MASRHVARAFSKLHADATKASEAEDAELMERQRAAQAERQLQESEAPMSLADSIPRILQSWEDKDLFRLLGLPAVEVDARGKPTWECTDKDVSRAYRKLSLLVHPDKPVNTDNPKAREAFERLNDAHRILRDPAKLVDEMNRHIEAAKLRRSQREANATLEERVALNAARSKEAQELRRTEGQELQRTIKAQMEKRRLMAQQKRHLKQKARTRHDSDEDAAEGAGDAGAGAAAAKAGSDDSDDDVHRRLSRMSQLKRRRR